MSLALLLVGVLLLAVCAVAGLAAAAGRRENLVERDPHE